MGDALINNNVSAVGIKQYYVSGANGSSMVRVAFDPHSTATSRTSTGSGSGVLISIGTKNLSSNAAVSNAINRAVNNINIPNPANMSKESADAMVKESTDNILKAPDQAIKAASMYLPNEDVMSLLV